MYTKLPEEELKSKVGRDLFTRFDCTQIIGKIDFSVAQKENPDKFYYWAEVKRGSADLIEALIQLVLTIGRVRTQQAILPPNFLGAFNAERMLFVPYSSVQDVFAMNDFNWNVRPSNHSTREFRLLRERIEGSIEQNSLIFAYSDEALRQFIAENFHGSASLSTITIDKNNFITVYHKWLEEVQPSISIDWELAKEGFIIDGDFYLADLLSKDNESLKDNLYVVLQLTYYELGRTMNKAGLMTVQQVGFADGQKAHRQFWNKYERPPLEEYWDYIVERRDLLVPQDIRERKGSFFTPRKWVELSQRYLADVLGEHWQDEYYIWDCAAGTGNLLHGLVNKYRIFASTIDKQDVDVIQDRIANGANLLKDYVFQFDFLHSDFSALPQQLGAIIADPEKRKKLIVYINPPYAEATTAKNVTRTGEMKAGVTSSHAIHAQYKENIGKAANEFFALFLAHVHEKLAGCILAQFSTLKHVQGESFERFRERYPAEFLKGFVVPGNTFDNVQDAFPIGFSIWDTGAQVDIGELKYDVYDADGEFLFPKHYYGALGKRINAWIKGFDCEGEHTIAWLPCPAPDFQNNQFLFITSGQGTRHVRYINMNENNLIPACVYFATRHALRPSWLNNRDQFLWPQEGWANDIEFQNNCLVYTIFAVKNKTAEHWIPFAEQEVNAQQGFAQNFLYRFMRGKAESGNSARLLWEHNFIPSEPLQFSPEAQAVLDAGRELFALYHAEAGVNVNASIDTIKRHFKGSNPAGRMNPRSDNEQFNALDKQLRACLQILEKRIARRVYEHGFLMR